MKRDFSIGLIFAAATLCVTAQSSAQICPPDDGTLRPGASTTISGTIRYHDELRQWLELEVNPPVCGQKELQLTFLRGDSSATYRNTTALDGCKVAVIGSIEFSPTAHYSTEMFVQDSQIEPDPSCHPKALAPDRRKAPIPADLQSYEVKVALNFANTSQPMHGAARLTDGSDQELTPWQAYINPWLNGSEDLLWVTCRDGFRLKEAVTEANGIVAKPADWLSKEIPGLSASEKPGPSSITITCVRASNQPKPTGTTSH